MTTLSITRAADIATEGVLLHGGATVSVVTLAEPTSGYAVALPGHEYAVPRVLTSPDGPLDALEVYRVIREYVEDHRAVLALPGNHLGAWLEDDVLVLDVSTVIDARQDAVVAGTVRDQRAIFNLATGETITL